jgi:hypothetical protein
MPRPIPDNVRLLHGPFKAPPLRRGDRAFCFYRDKEVIITRWSSGRIPWPLCKPFGRGYPGLLVDEEGGPAVPGV